MKGLTLVSSLALGILMFSGSVANAICVEFVGFCDRMNVNLTPTGVSSFGLAAGIHDYSNCFGTDSVASGNLHSGVGIVTSNRAVDGQGTFIYEFDIGGGTWCNRENVGGVLQATFFCGTFTTGGSCLLTADALEGFPSTTD